MGEAAADVSGASMSSKKPGVQLFVTSNCGLP